MQKSGAQILIDSLLSEGVDTIFGYPGGVVLPIYDVLYDSEMRHILTRHEQGAAHAADGYARASGKPGVCLSTSGPGATNLVTGIANAYMDSIPMLAITGQVTTSALGRDSFQEADIIGITLPITKHSFLLRDPKEIARTVREALYIATSGRPGPVLIDIPKDVSAGMTECLEPGPVQLPGYSFNHEPKPEQVARAVRAIEESERPVIYAGGGVINGGASGELLELAELMLMPVATTMMGLGGFPGNHPLSMGMLGMHGSKYANFAINECDLLVGIGVRFDDRVTSKLEEFAPDATIMHIDIDPAEIGKNMGVDIPVVGEVRLALRRIIDQLKPRVASQWRDKIAVWKKEHPLDFEVNGQLKPQEVVREICNVTKSNARITTEVGQHQMFAAQHYTFTKPRTFISSGGLGTMGFGFPAAIGVQVACPEETVIDIAGDGSIQMNIQELATAVNYNLPVKIAIINNGFLGMVRQWQELFYNRRYSYTELANPDFVKLAEAYGAVGMRVNNKSELREVLEAALAVNKPVVLDIPVEREENVYPMVAPGEPIHKMLG